MNTAISQFILFEKHLGNNNAQLLKKVIDLLLDLRLLFCLFNQRNGFFEIR